MQLGKPLICAMLIAGALAMPACKSGPGGKIPNLGKGSQPGIKDTVSWVAPNKYSHLRPLVENSLSEVNGLLPDGRRTARVEVVEQDSASPSPSRYLSIYEPYPLPKVILGSTFLGDSLLAQLALFHEQSHAYYEFSLADSQKQGLKLLFSRASNHQFYILGAKGKVPSVKLSDSEIDRLHPIFSLFDESNYFKGADWQYGHPYERAPELFASASSVLRFYPREFLSKLQYLESKDAIGAEIARSIASAVITGWGGSGFFSPLQ